MKHPAKAKRGHFYTQTHKGRAIRVAGDGDMDEKTLDALRQAADLAVEQFTQVKLEKLCAGCYRVMVNGQRVGTVRRTRWSSGSATEWKASNSATRFQSRKAAVDSLVNNRE